MTGSRLFATSASKIDASAGMRRSAQPCFCPWIQGRRRRRERVAFTGLRSYFFASEATYDSAFGRLSFTRSLTSEPGAAASA